MTTDERTRLSLAFLTYLERATLAKEAGDLATARAARAEADRLRLILLRDEPRETP
jgi:hypothetical protein